MPKSSASSKATPTVSEISQEFVTVAEIAQRLKLNEQTVRNWIDAGTLPAVRVGRRVRVRVRDIDELISPRPALEARHQEQQLTDARAELDASLLTAARAGNDRSLAEALRLVARAANALARVLERQEPTA